VLFTDLEERSRNSSLYNLEDDAQLTHFGQSLADIDDFDQTDLLCVSDDDGDIKESVVRQDHFGGNFDDDDEDAEEKTDPNRVKTKAEVMQEVIAKSKMYKHERQQQHDEDLDEIEALDADMGELTGLLRGFNSGPRERIEKTQEMLSYDNALREMIYDKRSKPTERTKTEAEIAQEESERLQKLEEERRRRMRGEEPEEGDRTADRQRGRREGDDLDDDFVPDAEDESYYGLGKGAVPSDEEASVDRPEDAVNVEEDTDNNDQDESILIDDGDDFDLAEYFTDEEDISNAENNRESEDFIAPASKKLKLADASEAKELAYTFPCPSTFNEMLDILKGVPVASVPTVIERIEILYSIKLLAENHEKLEVEPSCLVADFRHSPPSSSK